MYYGKVIGKVISTIKADGLKGKKIMIVRPVDMSTGLESKHFIAATDMTDCGLGDYVAYEDGQEAAWAYDPEFVPTDATIVAIIDSINIKESV